MTIQLTALQRQRRDTAANWTAENPTLLAGEIGIESDTLKWKVGNGGTAWNSLAYIPGLSISAYPLAYADISATAEIAVSKLADGAARQLLQTDAAGTGVEWANNIDIPGTLDVTGAATFDAAVTVQGDLTVNGTTTTIDTANLAIEDKNIEIGKVTTPTDVTADGGGITLKGTTDKTINWVDATDAWTLSEHVNIASAKEYRIAGTKVLDATSLGSAVVSSSLTSVGTIGAGVWQGTAISKTYLDATLVSTGDTGTVTSTMILDGTIVNADINASAAIVDTKLATIATAGKVSNSATTATNALGANTIVARDASNNFSAGTITAALIGNASTATSATSATSAGTATNCTRSVSPGTNMAGGGALTSDVTLSLIASPSVTNLQYSAAVWTGVNNTTTSTTSIRTVINKGTIYSCNNDAGGTSNMLTLQRSASGGNVARFVRGTGSVGTISVTASATSYNTTSDYRLKENVVSLSGAIARLNQLSVYRFNFIVDPTVVVDGFIAHEAQEVVPECVTGLKDAVDEDGDPIYQGIDQSKLVPLLTAALQEAIAKIEVLEQRLNDAGIN